MDPGHDAMAMATVRSHVPCSRPRLAPYAVGALRRCSRGAVPRSRVRAQRRAVGLRGWGSIVPIHTRPTVVWRRSRGARGSNGRTSQILLLYYRSRVGKGLKYIERFASVRSASARPRAVRGPRDTPDPDSVGLSAYGPLWSALTGRRAHTAHASTHRTLTLARYSTHSCTFVDVMRGFHTVRDLCVR